MTTPKFKSQAVSLFFDDEDDSSTAVCLVNNSFFPTVIVLHSQCASSRLMKGLDFSTKLFNTMSK